MTEQDYINIICEFKTDVKANSVVRAEPYDGGHINSTLLISVDGKPEYILQKINTNVFRFPAELMNNIVSVTKHIAEKLKANGEDPMRGTLTVIDAKDGKNYFVTDDGDYYRVFAFIDAISHETTEKPEQFYRAAKTYGKFQKMLNDFPADKLFEVIPNFHNTPDRFAKLEKAIAENKSGRLKNARAEVEFALSYKDRISYVTNGIANGEIPLRVTHNDTKLNNFLFDRDTDECICAIDLDTVMPGSLLYDYGDALRIGCSSAPEDETDLSKVHFCEAPFEQFTKGFLEALLPVLSNREFELLPYSAMLMTYEVGIRFLTDYLDGDTYFKTAYPDHNIVRARNQFKLVMDIDEKTAHLNEKVKEIAKKI